jgi:hypothetical protein
MGLTKQNPATLEGNGIRVWGEPPKRHPGADGVADATNPEIDAAYDDGTGKAAPAGKLAGPEYAASESSSTNAETTAATKNKEARRG